MSPRRAPSPCRYPHCPALTTSGWCPEHQKVADLRDRELRGTSTERGYGRHWAAYSKAYRKAHPLCVMCQAKGAETPSEQVDHITPVEGPHDRRFWDPSNHQALCATCHHRKTLTVDKRGLKNPPLVRSTVQPPTAAGGWIW